MAAIRGLCVIFALAAFFLIGTLLQWLIGRIAPAFADRIPTFFCRTLLRLLGVRVIIEGAHLPAGPVLAVANHVSWIDILALGSIRPFCFLAKSEVARWPVLSAFAHVQDTVFVDRKRRRTILSANRQIAARLEDRRSALLFPEGTTVGGPEPGRFRTSHFAAARDLIRRGTADVVPIQPIAIAYSSRQAAWIGDDDLVSHVWRTLRAPPLHCVLAFGAPLPYVADSDRKVVAAAARESVRELLARVVVDRTDACVTLHLDPAAPARI